MASNPFHSNGSTSNGKDSAQEDPSITSSSIPNPLFKVRLINIDHVLTSPGPLDKTESAFNAPGYPLRKVPVIRIFGATPSGQRVCAHVHGVFPYCYVAYKGSLQPDQVLSYIHKFGKELNRAIAASLRRDVNDLEKVQFIVAIHLVKGVPFYGYAVGWKYFLKISFVDPNQNVRIATILQSGKILNTKFQPFEIHIRYNLQFMLDFNLFGCDYVDFLHVLFRLPLPKADPFHSQESLDAGQQSMIKQWNDATIPNQLVQPDSIMRNSYCALEIDCHCIDILNRLRLQSRDQHNTFENELNVMKKRFGQRLVPSLTGLWEEEQIRRVNKGLSPTIPEPDPTADQRQFDVDQSPRWLATERHETMMKIRKENEAKILQPGDRSGKTFTKVAQLDHHIVTTFDSVLLVHGLAKHNALPDSISDLGDGSAAGATKSSTVYDLEKRLSQGFSPQKTNLSSSSSLSKNNKSVSSNELPSAEKKIDGDQDEDQLDLAFFSSQAFQTRMRKNENEIRSTERGDDESDTDEFKQRKKPTPQKSPSKSSSGGKANASSSPFKSPSKRKRERDQTTTSSSNGSDFIVRSRVRFDESTLVSNTTPKRNKSNQFVYGIRAPTRTEVIQSFPYFGLPIVEHKDPFFSNPFDLPKAREYAGRTFEFTSITLPYLQPFDESSKTNESNGKRIRKWEFGRLPPARVDLVEWVKDEEIISSQRRQKRFLTIPKPGITQAPSFGFKFSQREKTSLVQRGKQHMTILAIEILVCTRGNLFPDPAKDQVEAIAYSFQHEDETLEDTGSRPGLRSGLIINQPQSGEQINSNRLGISHLAIELVESELDLFNALIDLVRLFDPEILVGYEIHSSSWGYLVERASIHLNYDLTIELGRVNSFSTGSRDDRWGATQYSSLRFTGRHTLNIWRLMRGELALNTYSFENVCFHLLRKRVAKFDHSTITEWYKSTSVSQRSRALLYWIERVELDLELIETSELVFRTAEFAKIYGIDFFSVISRGSQFKVESVMFRIAKPESFLLPSPSHQQVGLQNAAEDLPLVMEPLSAFYKGPVLVLDFQSLYPSMMIAYNLCYSTCLGRISKFRDSWKLGYTSHDLPRGLFSFLEKDCHLAPNGILYTKSHVRKSLLAKMLTEILDTRQMVKSSVKGNKHDRAFVRLQNARQLSLKLLANVTYGYTSATFSGRMPCVEIADSIVRYGRETLEKAIEKIHSTSEWGAQVVYGDTDSLFIYLENRTKEEAFKIGNEIADTITAANPKPVKLKFEKVYLPSVLLAKKRYVGFMYESLGDLVPTFNAKGIETVRRDGFPAQQRMVEACIRILFRTQDLSQVKQYCQRQWIKILQGKISIQDFIFAKEVKLGSYSENGVPPPGAALAAKRMLMDKRSQCQYGERVPYVITQGAGKARLIDLARDPMTLLKDRRQTINGIYYITRGLIPPLTRIFNLLGADVESWFRELPKYNSTMYSLAALMRDRQAASVQASSSTTMIGLGGGRLLDHYRADVCLVCRLASENEICVDCKEQEAKTTFDLLQDFQSFQKRLSSIDQICSNCANSQNPNEQTPCINLDCPMVYEKYKTQDELSARESLQNKWMNVLKEAETVVDHPFSESLQW